MDPLSTTESLKRDLTSALSSSSSSSSCSREQHSLDVVKKRIQCALDFVVLSDGKTNEDRLKKIFIANDAEDASRVVVAGEEEELDKIETLAQFFYQCASVDLTPRAFDERLENLTTTTTTTTLTTGGGGGGGEKVGKKAKISEETKDALRQTYVKKKT